MLEYGKLKPMEPRSAEKPFDSGDYLYQVKWDGVRILAFIEDGQVKLQNRKLKPRTHVYPDFSNLNRYVKGDGIILDGEMVVLINGKPSFPGILKRDLKTHEAAIKMVVRRIPATYIAFDLLAYNHIDLTKKDLNTRLKILRDITNPHDYFYVIEDFDSGISLFRVIEEQGMEGIVAKRRDSIYVPGKKTDHWLKIKTKKDLIAVIGGYTIKERRLSSLLLGVYYEKNFFYIGNAATGLTSDDIKLLTTYLKEFEREVSPFINPPKLYGVITHWVKPLLTVKVEFMEWTDFFQLRAPVIKGFTKDKPEECVIQ